MENFSKAKQLIESSQRISVLPSPNSESKSDSLAAGLALFYSLKKLNKNVNLITKNSTTENGALQESKNFAQSQGDFLIAIKEKNVKLSQLFYEKTEDGLNLYLKTAGGKLKKEDIFLTEMDNTELLITLGVKKINEISEKIAKQYKYLVNIDNDDKNEHYGQANIVNPNTASLSEIVFDFLFLFNKDIFDEKVSEYLFYGIAKSSAGFTDKKVNYFTFQKANFLMEKGADLDKINNQLKKAIDLRAFKLFNQVLNKIIVFKEKSLGIVFLSEKDFFETKTTPTDLKFTLEKFSSQLFIFKNFLIVWQVKNSPSLVRGVFYSSDQFFLLNFLEIFGGEKKGNGILFQSRSRDFRDIKNEVLNLFKLK